MKIADRLIRYLVTFDDRLFRALATEDDDIDEGTLLRFLSPESIKHLFDSIRNFGLVAVVGAAGVSFAKYSSLAELALYYLFAISALVLFGLNVIFV